MHWYWVGRQFLNPGLPGFEAQHLSSRPLNFSVLKQFLCKTFINGGVPCLENRKLKWEYSPGARERDIQWTYGHRLKFSIFSLCSSPGRQLIRKTYCRKESFPLSEKVTQISGSIRVWWQQTMIWQWTNSSLLILEGWPCLDPWASPIEDGATSSWVFVGKPFLLTRHRPLSSWS